MDQPIRIVIYGHGTPEQIAAQLDRCRTLAEELGTHTIVAVASDLPGHSEGWNSANRMVETGQADQVLVASRDHMPGTVDSVTQYVSRHRPRRLRPFRRT